jgi:hypothetical protein
MRILESTGRILIALIAILIWLAMIILPVRNALASDPHEAPHKKKPPVVTVAPAPTPAADTDRHSENLLGAAAASGLLAAALRDQQYGAMKAFGVTVAGAAAIEAAHSGGFNHSNLWRAAAGAAAGSIGVCALYFRKGFIGCAVPW